MAKRSNIRPQYGSIRRKHGAWFWERYEAGKKKMTRIAGDDELRSKKDVAAEINKLIARLGPLSITAKDAPRTGNISIAEFAKDTYLPWAKAETKPATYYGYLKMWQHRLEKHVGARRLNEYFPYHATEFLSSLARAGLGRNTIAHARAVLSGIFAHAVSLGHLQMNPIAGAKLLNKPKASAKTQHYTLQEMAEVLTALDSDETARQHSIMALAFLGLRRAEISGLKWEDLNIDGGSLWVRRSAWQGKASETAKNSQSVREVTIGDVAAASLTRLERLYKSKSLKGYLFENEKGGPLELGLFASRILRPTLELKGVKVWKGYHSARRGVETEMQRYTNGNSQITSHHFGHSKEVADANYTKPLPDETRKAVLAFDAGLAQAITAIADTSGHRTQ
jgi:integrase